MCPVLANVFGLDSLWVVVIALVVLFGGSQLPKLARNTGEALKEFKKAQGDAAAAAQAPEPVQQAPAQASVQVPVQVASPAAVAPALASGTSEERVSLTRAELDALLADREARAKREAEKPES
jgi:sec-independent protein translocase protein TatA